MLDLLKAAILGIVEGITEWLPISSTGHLILVDEFISLGMSDAFKEMFDVVIQFGAILAVVVLFWGKLWPFCNRRAVRHNGEGVGHYLVRRYCKQDVWLMWFKVLVAVLPAMLIGLPLDDWMTEHLHNPPVVAAMLILYGVLFIVVESHPRQVKMTTVESLSWATALGIGLFQVLSLVPGTSRSGATILGGILLGCSRTLAAEFTFFLAIPVMFGWGVLKLLEEKTDVIAQVAGTLKVSNVHDLPARAAAVAGEVKALQKELDELKAREARSQLEGLFENAKEVQGVKLFTLYLTGTPTETVRTMCDAARDRVACSVTAIVAENEGKYSLAVAVGKEAQAKGLAAGRLAKEIASVAGGNGGGKPDFAMAGIRDASKIDDALNAVPGIVEKALNA